MKYITAYYLMLIYVTVVIKPLMPFIHDAWDHQFNEIEHISIVHAKYGSNHLEKELACSGADKSQNQNTLRSEDQVSFHIPTTESEYTFIVNNNEVKYLPFKYNRLPFIYIFKRGQPPQFS